MAMNARTISAIIPFSVSSCPCRPVTPQLAEGMLINECMGLRAFAVFAPRSWHPSGESTLQHIIHHVAEMYKQSDPSVRAVRLQRAAAIAIRKG